MSYWLKRGMALLFIFSVGCFPAVAAPERPFQQQNGSISFGVEFASGDYGTSTTTRSVYMPLIVTWFPTDRIDVGIEVPYIYQSNPNITTSLYQNNPVASTLKTLGRKGGPGGNGIYGSSLATSSPSTSSVSGLGDIIFRMGFIALFEGDKTPQLRPSLSVKFPTASTSDGLGTGEFDAGAGLEATKWVDDMFLTAEALYNYQGRVSGFGLTNYLSYTAGLGYQVTDSLQPMLLLKGATKPSLYSGELLEARFRILWDVTRATALDLYLSRGITDSSPEYGAGASIAYTF